jgi:hypothetical protein
MPRLWWMPHPPFDGSRHIYQVSAGHLGWLSCLNWVQPPPQTQSPAEWPDPHLRLHPNHQYPRIQLTSSCWLTDDCVPALELQLRLLLLSIACNMGVASTCMWLRVGGARLAISSLQVYQQDKCTSSSSLSPPICTTTALQAATHYQCVHLNANQFQSISLESRIKSLIKVSDFINEVFWRREGYRQLGRRWWRMCLIERCENDEGWPDAFAIQPRLTCLFLPFFLSELSQIECCWCHMKKYIVVDYRTVHLSWRVSTCQQGWTIKEIGPSFCRDHEKARADDHHSCNTKRLTSHWCGVYLSPHAKDLYIS